MSANAISQAIRALRTRLAVALPLPEDQILIGNPADAAVAASNGSKQYVNLFVFRIEHAGYPADATSADPVYVRLHCLITPFGNDDSGASGVKAGEHELRMAGGVIAALHAAPVLPVNHPDGTLGARLQVVPAPLTIESLNNLWSTQLQVSQRTSLAYELALAPTPFEEQVDRSPRVATAEPLVRTIGAPAGEWAPEIAFDDGSGLATALTFASSAAPATVKVAAAGVPATVVTLQWEQWDATSGWRVASTAPFTIQKSTLSDATPVDVALPGPPTPGAKAQNLLTAVRQWTDRFGATHSTRSNPLLVSFHEG